MITKKVKPNKEFLKKGRRLITSKSLNQSFSHFFACNNKVLNGLVSYFVNNSANHIEISKGTAILEHHLVYFPSTRFQPSSREFFIALVKSSEFPAKYQIVELDSEALNFLQNRTFVLPIAHVQDGILQKIEQSYCKRRLNQIAYKSFTWFSTTFQYLQSRTEFELDIDTGVNSFYQEIFCNGLKLRESVDYKYTENFYKIRLSKEVDKSFILVVALHANVRKEFKFTEKERKIEQSKLITQYSAKQIVRVIPALKRSKVVSKELQKDTVARYSSKSITRIL